jgi:uncharacterized protein YecT (DUF1311 family)
MQKRIEAEKSFLVLFFKKALLALPLLLPACTIHHVTPYVPDASIAPQTADAAATSANCAEASTTEEQAICAQPSLIAANRAMLQTFHERLRGASLFGRDALLASQRNWLLGLPAECHLSDSPADPPRDTPGCLAGELADRDASLRSWPASAPNTHGALAQYISLRPLPRALHSNAAFCDAFASRANQALRRTGTLDPAAMGYQEVAGSHGPAASPPIAIDLYDANAFALFERRARNVRIGGASPAITPASLTQLVEQQNTANQGGRFSAFASQTGDYGSIDVFKAEGLLLAFAADPWGYTTPAAPGEAAHAGLWSITGADVTPNCAFDTYVRPAEPGPFASLPSFTPWRTVLDQIRDSATLALGSAVLRDQGQLTADTNFVILHMPLLAIEQAGAPGQTLWLRHRHDQVLDALFAWSVKSIANKAKFDQAIAPLRQAATDLVRAYQTTQGLSAAEASQAAGIAMMELLYQAAGTIAPSLGDRLDLKDASKPRYPILAAPQ